MQRFMKHQRTVPLIVKSKDEEKKMKYHVVEKFVSINGEGKRAGQLSVFIRFRGCNLNCSYCDTKWANTSEAPAEIMTESEIYQYIKNQNVKNVTLTGGEPLIQPGIEILLQKLTEDPELRVEIETNGSINLAPYRNIHPAPEFTVDYKLPGSGQTEHMFEDNFANLQANDTVKFVAGSKEDLVCAKAVMDKYHLVGKCHVYLSPVFGKIEPAEMVLYMEQEKMNDVNLQLQLHKFIWNPELRGV